MKIISWNIWDKNKNLEESLALVFSKKPDIVCLQEFRKDQVSLLEKYPDYDYFLAEDISPLIKHKLYLECYLVVMAKKEYKLSEAKISYPQQKKNSLLYKILQVDEGREFIQLDIDFKNNKYRLFNVHFSSATNPAARINQLNAILNRFSDDRVNIICGDFNAFGKFLINLAIGWLYGFGLKDLFLNESKIIKKIIAGKKLKDIFADRITYLLLKQKLDYMIIPQELPAEKTELCENSLQYSDHYMLAAEIN